MQCRWYSNGLFKFLAARSYNWVIRLDDDSQVQMGVGTLGAWPLFGLPRTDWTALSFLITTIAFVNQVMFAV
jgi:hypothetical protein